MFYRLNDDGNAVIFNEDGSATTRIHASRTIYPVDSDLSTLYEHPRGIVLTVQDAESVGIFEEDEE